MKDHVDTELMGIVTHIAEALAKIKPGDPLRLANRETRKKQNYSDSSSPTYFKNSTQETEYKNYDQSQGQIFCFFHNTSGNSPVKILTSRCTWKERSRVKTIL
jgi:hypothetical protein